MNKNIYTLKNLCKLYKGPAEDLLILDNLNLGIAAGEHLSIIGASGSGKSTLLHILGTLDSPSSGEALFEEKPLSGLSEDEKAEFRNRHLGFIFQFHYLLPEFNTLENVAMQAVIGGTPGKEALKRAKDILEMVGLKERGEHPVTTLSGGERQRAAIARAILQNPKVLLADEPTGNLDEKTGRQIADLLLSLNRDMGLTLIVVTHNLELARRSGRILELKQGGLAEFG
ncbi:MAG: ABC transporter ATP-binding protein [Deltaproteobacteria bacterium]|jgi:lipoprotein-releasing system ATP-binding protein|nr:ABC transporter ATP-binding protein [Deltaproteobacteria bacterium]